MPQEPGPHIMPNLSQGVFKTKSLPPAQKKYIERLIDYAFNCLDPKQTNRFLFPKTTTRLSNKETELILKTLEFCKQALSHPRATFKFSPLDYTKNGGILLKFSVVNTSGPQDPKYIELHITEGPYSHTHYVTGIKITAPCNKQKTTHTLQKQTAQAMIPLPKHENR